MKHMTRDERIGKFVDLLDNKLVEQVIQAAYKSSFMQWLEDEGYFDAPASAHHHGRNKGDLFRHSLRVAEILADHTDKLGLEWLRPCSPWVVGLFHDLCKMDNYIPYDYERNGIQIECDGFAKKWDYNREQLLNGHGEKSVMLLSQFAILTEEEILCIRYHMGGYETGEREQFDRAIRKYPNVLYTHTADMLASKVCEI